MFDAKLVCNAALGEWTLNSVFEARTTSTDDDHFLFESETNAATMTNSNFQTALLVWQLAQRSWNMQNVQFP